MILKTIEKNNLKIKIVTDIDPMNPREFDNIGTIVSCASGYNLGDKQLDREEIEKIVKKKGTISIPVYAYQHGNIILKTSPFGCRFDSGQIGIIYAEKSKILKEYGEKTLNEELIAKVIKNFQSEIETYSQFLNGEVYGFTVEKENICTHCDTKKAEILESCYGFYSVEEAESEAISIAESL